MPSADVRHLEDALGPVAPRDIELGRAITAGLTRTGAQCWAASSGTKRAALMVPTPVTRS